MKDSPKSSKNISRRFLKAARWVASVALLVGVCFFALGLYFLSPFAEDDPFPQFGWAIVLGCVLGIAIRRLVRWANDDNVPTPTSCLIGLVTLIFCVAGAVIPIHVIRISPTISWWPFGYYYFGTVLAACIIGDPWVYRQEDTT